ncbi:MAG: endoglucanase, partial [Clostridia bacterium]|nr:endoglucanase [Clostridia bacterium]
NEMNTDWTNYSGIINLSDPEIYIGCWQRVYEIFAEEGVDNAIWVFNPNDRNYPPCNWNNYLAYYPGDRYVQMIGVTGYNTGTYFKDVTGEDWRSFTQIYDEVNEAYLPFFSEFPWMITEFASSSIGGNKPMWITNMFENLDRYPNIKAAVWFSAPDMDMRPGYEGKISRPYMLDETPETLAAFGKGLKKTGAKSATK